MRLPVAQKLCIPITSEMKKKMDDRIRECGHVTTSEYIRVLLRKDLGYKQ